MQTNDRNDESHARPETAAVNPVPTVARKSAEIDGAALARVEMEMEVPVAGQHALRRRDELSPERIANIRQRILEGAYASDAVLETVARRILKSRDL
jgi:hypothetical protein